MAGREACRHRRRLEAIARVTSTHAACRRGRATTGMTFTSPMNSETNVCCGVRVDFLRRADLHQLAGAHHADAVAHHHRLFEGVGDVDEGLAGLAVDVLQLLLERLAQLVVDAPTAARRRTGSRGSKASARASATRCRSPPEHFVHALAVVVLRQAQQVASARSARALRVSGATPRIFSGNSMFSPTVRCGNSASDWNTMQVGRLLAGMSLMRSPRRRMSPAGRRLHAGQHAQQRGLAASPTARRW